jgi:carbonic anhydrase
VAEGVVGVLTCMDPRVNVRDFGTAFRDAFVLRNAGARATQDVVRSFVVAWRLAGATEFVVVHHTDCRMMAVTDDQLRDNLARTTGADVTGMEFLTFTDLRSSVQEDVERLSRSRYLATVPVSGFVWDLGARQLQPVVVDPRSRLADRRARAARGAAKPRQAAGSAGTAISVPTGGIFSPRPR